MKEENIINKNNKEERLFNLRKIINNMMINDELKEKIKEGWYFSGRKDDVEIEKELLEMAEVYVGNKARKDLSKKEFLWTINHPIKDYYEDIIRCKDKRIKKFHEDNLSEIYNLVSKDTELLTDFLIEGHYDFGEEKIESLFESNDDIENMVSKLFDNLETSQDEEYAFNRFEEWLEHSQNLKRIFKDEELVKFLLREIREFDKQNTLYASISVHKRLDPKFKYDPKLISKLPKFSDYKISMFDSFDFSAEGYDGALILTKDEYNVILNNAKKLGYNGILSHVGYAGFNNQLYGEKADEFLKEFSNLPYNREEFKLDNNLREVIEDTSSNKELIEKVYSKFYEEFDKDLEKSLKRNDESMHDEIRQEIMREKANFNISKIEVEDKKYNSTYRKVMDTLLDEYMKSNEEDRIKILEPLLDNTDACIKLLGKYYIIDKLPKEKLEEICSDFDVIPSLFGYMSDSETLDVLKDVEGFKNIFDDYGMLLNFTAKDDDGEYIDEEVVEKIEEIIGISVEEKLQENEQKNNNPKYVKTVEIKDKIRRLEKTKRVLNRKLVSARNQDGKIYNEIEKINNEISKYNEEIEKENIIGEVLEVMEEKIEIEQEYNKKVELSKK